MMKTRQGFVSNSSSSSFLIVGTQNGEIIDKLWTLEGFPEEEKWCDYGYRNNDGSPIYFHGSDEPYYVGIPVEHLMKTMTLPQMIEKFIKLLKTKYKIDIPKSQVGLHYGRSGN